MNIRNWYLLLTSLLLVGSLSGCQSHPTQAIPALVPLPLEVIERDGRFTIHDDSSIVLHENDEQVLRPHAEVLQQSIDRLWQVKLPIRVGGEPGRGDIVLARVEIEGPEGAYRLRVGRSVWLEGRTVTEVAHAGATLIQLMGTSEDQSLSRVEVRDAPDAVFRSFLVDLGRNPHSLQSLKQAVDWLWLYKVNYLHLHMTDDQRFAFPSQAYPALQKRTPDFTIDQLRELDRYAAARGVSIIPELEAPGHSTILRREYPEVFGKTPTDLATLASARAGLKTIIDEMIDVFASARYIHIGCDEAFGVPGQAQRDLINDLNAHVRSRGKTTIVWEGPYLGEGDNKVSTDVVHMAWRMMEFPPDQMIEAGYKVVNAAWDPLYIVDHYPRNNFTMAAPEQVYGLDRWRFSHFNPDLRSFKPIRVPVGSDVIGYCMPWWEGRERNFFILCPPRIAPMAARAWNAEREIDYNDFAMRNRCAWHTIQRVSTPVKITPSPLAINSAGVFHRETTITLSSVVPGQVYFTTDGSVPTPQSDQYTLPFRLERSAVIRAVVYENAKRVGHVSELLLTHVDPVENLALGKPIESSVPSGPHFTVERLTDGGLGKLDFFVGYSTVPEPILLQIDLEAVMDLNRIVVHAYTNGRSFEDYTVWVSADGDDFQQVGAADRTQLTNGVQTHKFSKMPTRYLRIVTKGHRGQVYRSFTRLIEIQAFGDE